MRPVTVALLLSLVPTVAFATETTGRLPPPFPAQDAPAEATRVAEPPADLPLAAPVAVQLTAPEVRPVVEDPDAQTPEPFNTFYHGFRMGYTYINGIERGGRLASPHLFVVGYELTRRIQGGDWLNVIAVGNVSVAGINQSLFLPSMNGLIGFEFAHQFQIGTGVNLAPFDPNRRFAHQIVAVGWTPKAGAFNVPIHFTVIPDVDGHWRVGSTVGVNW